MSTSRWYCTVYAIIALSTRLAFSATENGVNTESPRPTLSPTDGPFSPTTPAPGPVDTPPETWYIDVSKSNATAEPGTQTPDSTAIMDPTTSDANLTTTGIATQAPPLATANSVVIPEVCLCDLTPHFCDISCCCDNVDCDLPDLRTVFNRCPEREMQVSGECIEKWLMFRANVNTSLVTVTDTVFCVGPKDYATASQTLPSVSQKPAVLDTYHFSGWEPTNNNFHVRGFYKVDDVILTHFNQSTVRSLLRQPSSGAANSFCVNRNPAKFLRSVSLSCSRILTSQTCSTDSSLSAHSYFNGMSLVKFPIPETGRVIDHLIPVSPLSAWPKPREQNGTCLDVVSEVAYVIGYTGRGELTYATVNVTLVNVDANIVLAQKHSVQFQLATPRHAVPLRPAVGLTVGSPVIGRFDVGVQPLTVLGLSQGGECSADLGTRRPILFGHNILTGCTFSSPSRDCVELHAQLYGILLGLATPDQMAMNFGSKPDWTRVITQECSTGPQEDICESGCILPLSLTVQVLWARQGLLALSQSYILGAKYLFRCQKVKCPLTSPLAVTTEVTFADSTLYPEPPRGLPQPTWKFPFGFFTRRDAELDSKTAASNSGHLTKVTCDMVGVTITLFSILRMFNR